MSEQWMTYREAAAQHGVTAEAIRQLALRRRWPRRRTNTLPPRVEVLIPEGEQISPKPTAVERPSNRRSTPRSDTLREQLYSLVSAFETGLATLREQLQGAERRAEAAEQGREGAIARADRAAAQNAELRDRIDELQAQLRDAQAAAQRAEAVERENDARRAQGLLARLRAAWRRG